MFRLTPVTTNPGNYSRQQWPGLAPNVASVSRPTPPPNPPSPWTPAALEKTALKAGIPERPASNSTNVDNAPNHARARRHKRFGSWLLLLIPISLLLLGLSAGFLAWVWFGDRNDERWRRLITGDYSMQSITLTSVLVRYSIATLSWITGAMMVSVIVERYGVPLEEVAHASIARYTGTIFPFVLGGLAPWSAFTILLPLQLAIGIASQFTSTLLFSDIALTTVRGFPSELVVAYEFSAELNNVNDGKPDRRPDQDGTDVNRWSFNPTSFETFAEYAEPDQRIVADGVDDTGPILRAFLPIDREQTRSTLQEYRGAARVFDARVMCIRPTFTEFKARRDDEIGDGTLTGPRYAGVGFIETQNIPNIYAIGRNKTREFRFACSLSVPGGFQEGKLFKVKPKPYWEICEHESDDEAHRIPSLDPLFYKDDPDVEHDSLRFGRSYILMDSMNVNTEVFPFTTPGTNTSVGGSEFALPIQNATGNGPWLEFDSALLVSKGQINPLPNTEAVDAYFKIKATYCMEVMMPIMAPLKQFNITATSQANRTEPKFAWNAEKGTYDTSNARKQLGVTKNYLASGRNASDRGILIITPQSFRNDIVDVVRNASIQEDDLGGLREFVATTLAPTTAAQGPLIFCSDCLVDTFAVDRTKYTATAQYFENLFDDIVEDIDSPARAIQSINTVRARMAYQKWVSTFTEKATANATNFVLVQVPVRVSGYFAVMGIIAAQVLLVSCVGAVFMRTKFTYLNNAWQVIAQVSVAPAVADIVAQAPMMTDYEVSKYVRSGERTKTLGREGKCVEGRKRYALENGTFVPKRWHSETPSRESGMGLRWRFRRNRGDLLNTLQA